MSISLVSAARARARISLISPTKFVLLLLRRYDPQIQKILLIIIMIAFGVYDVRATTANDLTSSGKNRDSFRVNAWD